MSNEIAFSIPACAAARAAPTDPSRRPGHEHERRVLRRLVHRCDAAGGAHDERLGKTRLTASVASERK